jgi:hypothetical protein
VRGGVGEGWCGMVVVGWWVWVWGGRVCGWCGVCGGVCGVCVVCGGGGVRRVRGGVGVGWWVWVWGVGRWVCGVGCRVGCRVVWCGGGRGVCVRGSPFALEHSKVCTLCDFGHLQFLNDSKSMIKNQSLFFLKIDLKSKIR